MSGAGYFSDCEKRCDANSCAVNDEATTPLWLRVFAIASFAVVFGGVVWMFASSRKPRVAASVTPAAAELSAPIFESRAAVLPSLPTPLPQSPKPTATPLPLAQKPSSAAMPAAFSIPAVVIEKWNDPEGPELAVNFIKQWSAISPQDAAKWLSRQSDSPALHSAAESLVADWSAKDLPAATEWALGLANDGILKSLVLERLADAWSESNPPLGAVNYARISDAETRKVCAGALFDRWAKRDPGGMHAALARIPTVLADEARMSLAPVLFPRNSKMAMDVLCEVKNADERVAAVAQMFDYWRRRNRAAASAWLSGSSLSEQERQRISGGE